MFKICPSECPKLLQNNKVIILDIREQYEYDAVHLNSLHIPMAEIENKLSELKDFEKVIVMCHSGKRSEALVNYLETEFNLNNLLVMEGGIIAWKDKVDNSLRME